LSSVHNPSRSLEFGVVSVAGRRTLQGDHVTIDEPDVAVVVRPGEHACCRFAHAQDRLHVASAFVRDALARGHKVVYLCDGEDLDASAGALAGGHDDVAAALASGQFELRLARATYAPDGRFDIERVLVAIREDRERALADGYPALSITGEMAWARPHVPGSERLSEYERRFAEAMEGGEIVALCQYAHGEFEPATLAEVAGSHEVDLSPELAPLARTQCLIGARVDGGRTLRLAGELDFACADALATVLDGHFHDPLQLDLADLSYVDVAGMRAIRRHTGRPLTIAGASVSVRRMLGLLAWDTDPEVEVLA
jgi:ABC-type transporter Mla MlaB component